MKISSQQFAQLEQVFRDRFVARAVTFIRDEFPAVAARGGDRQLVELVAYAELRAAKYGFLTERDIMQYLVVMLGLGVHFDEDPRLTSLRPPLVDMPDTPSSTRLAFLLTLASEALGEGADNGG